MASPGTYDRAVVLRLAAVKMAVQRSTAGGIWLVNGFCDWGDKVLKPVNDNCWGFLASGEGIVCAEEWVMSHVGSYD